MKYIYSGIALIVIMVIAFAIIFNQVELNRLTIGPNLKNQSLLYKYHNLYKIRINDSDIDVKLVKLIKDNKQLYELSIFNCTISDEAIKALGALDVVKVINVNSNSLNNDNIMMLNRLTKYCFLIIESQFVTLEGVEKLYQTRKDYDINYVENGVLKNKYGVSINPKQPD